MAVEYRSAEVEPLESPGPEYEEVVVVVAEADMVEDKAVDKVEHNEQAHIQDFQEQQQKSPLI